MRIFNGPECGLGEPRGEGRTDAGGRGRSAEGRARNPGPSKTQKSKKITKHKSQKQNTKGKENTLTRGGGVLYYDGVLQYYDVLLCAVALVFSSVRLFCLILNILSVHTSLIL